MDKSNTVSQSHFITLVFGFVFFFFFEVLFSEVREQFHLHFLSSDNDCFVSKGVNIYEYHKQESKGVTSLLITPVPQSSVPSFAASKVGSPCLSFFFIDYNDPVYGCIKNNHICLSLSLRKKAMGSLLMTSLLDPSTRMTHPQL